MERVVFAVKTAFYIGMIGLGAWLFGALLGKVLP